MAKCQGLTLKGKPCKLKVFKDGYCQSHQSQIVPDIVPETSETPEVPIIPEVQTTTLTPETPFVPEVQTAVLIPEDRVLRYRMNPRCPECGAHPTVCMIRRKNYGFFKCRTCGHKFEVKR